MTMEAVERLHVPILHIHKTMKVRMNVALATNLNIDITIHLHITTPPSPKLSQAVVPPTGGITNTMVTSEQKTVACPTPGAPIETNAPHPLPKMCQEPHPAPGSREIGPPVNKPPGRSPTGLLLLGLHLLQQITGGDQFRAGNQYQGPTPTTPTKIQGSTSTHQRTTLML